MEIKAGQNTERSAALKVMQMPPIKALLDSMCHGRAGCDIEQCIVNVSRELTNHEAEISVSAGKDEVTQHSIVECRVPSDLNVVACLTLLHSLVVVSF